MQGRLGCCRAGAPPAVVWAMATGAVALQIQFILSAFRRLQELLGSSAMTQVVKWFYLVTLAVWVGSIVFFSFIVAPTVFKVLKPEDAAKLQRAMFPKYYLAGILCAALGIVCVGLLLADRAFGKWPGTLSLLLLAGISEPSRRLRCSPGSCRQAKTPRTRPHGCRGIGASP